MEENRGKRPTLGEVAALAEFHEVLFLERSPKRFGISPDSVKG